uniref:Uncharacterized protein n=1 Tax=Capra hircus TaxID=9925 RepID=A0A8C2NGI3_CAPHI
MHDRGQVLPAKTNLATGLAFSRGFQGPWRTSKCLFNPHGFQNADPARETCRCSRLPTCSVSAGSGRLCRQPRWEERTKGRGGECRPAGLSAGDCAPPPAHAPPSQG